MSASRGAKALQQIIGFLAKEKSFDRHISKVSVLILSDRIATTVTLQHLRNKVIFREDPFKMMLRSGEGYSVLVKITESIPGDNNMLTRQFVVRLTEMSGLKAQNHKHDHLNSKNLLTILDVNNIHYIEIWILDSLR